MRTEYFLGTCKDIKSLKYKIGIFYRCTYFVSVWPVFHIVGQFYTKEGIFILCLFCAYFVPEKCAYFVLFFRYGRDGGLN